MFHLLDTIYNESQHNTCRSTASTADAALQWALTVWLNDYNISTVLSILKNDRGVTKIVFKHYKSQNKTKWSKKNKTKGQKQIINLGQADRITAVKLSHVSLLLPSFVPFIVHVAHQHSSPIFYDACVTLNFSAQKCFWQCAPRDRSQQTYWYGWVDEGAGAQDLYWFPTKS